MSQVIDPSGLSLLERPVARKRPEGTDESASKKRGRARETGAVVPLGVEIDAGLHQLFEEARAERKWSKRTLVEEALKAFLATGKGVSLPPSKGKGH